jgi:hypothetical protein
MKTKHLLFIIGLLASHLLYAQTNSFQSLVERYEDEDDVTIVSITKAMFNLIPGNINTGNVDIKNIVPKIESLLLISSEKSNLKQKMSDEFKALIDKDKNFEELMRIKSGKSIITFKIKKKGDVITELIMFVNDENDFVAIQILGNFLLDDIQKIAKDSQTQ